MSIKAMTAVWEHSTQKEGSLLILLALADFAHDDGSGAFPSVATLAKKARMSERNTQYCLRRLEQAGEIVREGTHHSGAVIWRLVLPSIRGANIAGVQDLQGCNLEQGGVQFATQRGAMVAPKPLVTVKEPSESTRVSKARRKTSLPEGYQPDGMGWALARERGWGDARIEDEIVAFCAHHEKEATLSASWAASWRTWVLNGRRFDARDTARASPNGRVRSEERRPSIPSVEDVFKRQRPAGEVRR
jgi:hypothetical protein